MNYNEDYFERGIEAGVSLYTNYRWMPEATTKLAMALIDKLCIGRHTRVLDFGCAKGYLVKALRILWRDAYGCDISQYAIEYCDVDVVSYIKWSTITNQIPFDFHFNLCIAKDVFEHIEGETLDNVLYAIRRKCDKLFAVIPLGEGGVYNVPAYRLDKTHVVAENPEWWINRFEKNSWKLTEFSYRKEGIKDNWAEHKHGNGFFELY